MGIIPIRLERRLVRPAYWRYVGPVLALISTFAVATFFIVASGVSPLVAYGRMFAGAIGSPFAISETLTRSAPLMLTGVAVAIAFKAGFWNIGLEGQVYAGALAATAAGLSAGSLPPGLAVPFLLAMGFLGGMAWVLVPALLRILLNVNEVLTTLMTNYVMNYIVSLVLFGPWEDPETKWPMSPPISASAQLPELGYQRLHLGIIVAIVCAVVMYVIISRTVLGYRIRSAGENPRAASAAGINVRYCLLVAAVLSAGLAGLAGAGEVAGIHYRMRMQISSNFGWMGIPVGLLAQLNALAVIPTAIFLAGMVNGGLSMQETTSVPYALTDIMQGLIVIFVLAFQLLGMYKLKRART